jgi:hypothetical protein
VFVVVEREVIVPDQTTGLFGLRLELERDRNGTRMQARRSGYVREHAGWRNAVGSAGGVTAASRAAAG